MDLRVATAAEEDTCTDGLRVAWRYRVRPVLHPEAARLAAKVGAERYEAVNAEGPTRTAWLRAVADAALEAIVSGTAPERQAADGSVIPPGAAVTLNGRPVTEAATRPLLLDAHPELVAVMASSALRLGRLVEGDQGN
jgi:hypothetical protein